MSKGKLEDYENVKSRKLRFKKDFPDGRILPKLVNPETVSDHAIFVTTIYKNREEYLEDVPMATGYAHEIRDKEKKINRYGKEYESVNFTSWVENCEESSIGRALDNAGYASNKKCSRDEIEKADRMSVVAQKDNELKAMRNKVVNSIAEIITTADAGKRDGIRNSLLGTLKIQSANDVLKETSASKLTAMLQTVLKFKSLEGLK